MIHTIIGSDILQTLIFNKYDEEARDEIYTDSIYVVFTPIQYREEEQSGSYNILIYLI